MITLKQLKFFLALEETGHFRQAAELCGVSQPSLSVQIQNLEEELGMRLVERGRSGVALTPAGREVAHLAQNVANGIQNIFDFAEGARGGLAGTIKLGTTPTLGPYLLPHVVAALHKKYKELNLYVREGVPRDLEFELGRGLHDIILTQLPIASAEIVHQTLFREPLYVAVAVDHPLASKEYVTPKALRGLEVLSLSPRYHLHDQINALCQDFGAVLVRDYEGTSLDAVRQMVGMGMGISLLPALYVHSEIRTRSEVVALPIKGRSVYRSMALAWRKSAGRASAHREMAAIVKDVSARKFKDLVVESGR